MDAEQASLCKHLVWLFPIKVPFSSMLPTTESLPRDAIPSLLSLQGEFPPVLMANLHWFQQTRAVPLCKRKTPKRHGKTEREP